MPYILVGDDSRNAIDGLAEAGKDYHVVDVECVKYSIDGSFVVRSNGIALPYRDPKKRFYDFESFFEGKPLPTESQVVQLKNISDLQGFSMSSLAFPFGFVPTRGAYPLLRTTTLSHAAKFIRFTSTANDARYPGGVLSARTYLTS